MGNCFGVEDAKPLEVQILLKEKENEIIRMKEAIIAMDRRMLQDSQEMQELAKLREMLLLNALRELGQKRSYLETKNYQISLLNRQLTKDLNMEKTLNASLKQH